MKRTLIVILILVFLAGLGIALYPALRTASFRQAEREAVRQFERYRDVSVPDRTDPQTADGSPDSGRAFPELWEACTAYNEGLKTEQKAGFTAQAWEQPAFCLADYGWEQEAFGYITIPSADIEAPLYPGGSMENLERGAAILGQTSMPVGGEGTHCVVAGHRTWNAILHPFAGLEKVQVGDLIYLTNPWQTLTYRVTEVGIIFPDDSDRIRIRPGEDLLSVFTCTYPNTRRVLVTCERLSEEEEN